MRNDSAPLPLTICPSSPLCAISVVVLLSSPADTFPKAKAKAYTYAKLGDREQTLQWLEKAFDEHIRYVPYASVDPFFDSLHPEPRFQELLRRLGLQ